MDEEGRAREERKEQMYRVGQAIAYVGCGLALDRIVFPLLSRVFKKIDSNPDSRRLVLGAFITGALCAGGPMTYSLYKLRQFQKKQKDKKKYGRDFSVDPYAKTKASISPTDYYDQEMQERVRREVIEEMAIKRTSVTVRVPATSANMGPGFDCLGMALDMWSELTVERSNEFHIESHGEGSDQVPQDETNLVCMGVRKAFEVAGEPVPPLRYVCTNRIPFARGLGSSSAAIVAGLIAGLVLTGHKLTMWGEESLLQLAAAIEGHPDNVAPAIYGGIQLGIYNGERWQSERVTVPAGMQVVVFIPDTIGKTSDARAVLAQQVPREDAIFNVGRVAWLVNAFNMQRFDNLRHGAMDRLHQPPRANKVYPHLYPLIESATKAGAAACFLSGAGPAVVALTSGASGDIFAQREKERVDTAVAEAMLAAAHEAGVNGQAYITEPVGSGAHVAAAHPPYSNKLMRYRGDV
mmetsp:Transcript_19060/g.24705  ORF Transcript_19060/g.24705 Transcript_19060/m.24705 type:complete len:465 (-) Transcript_19060:358-1752(-)